MNSTSETSSIIFDAIKDSTIRGVATSVAADPHHVDADLDPTNDFDADPDADLDPDVYLMRTCGCGSDFSP